MTPYESFLLELNSNQMFQTLLKEKILPQRPHVPVYHPSKNNTEEWKYQSGFKDGFDLVLQLLKVKYE